MLEDIRKSYLQLANSIKGWETENKNDLINKYIDNKDNRSLRNSYFAAIMLRYWGNIFKYYNLSSKTIELEECYAMLCEAIKYILDTEKMHKWRDPNSEYSKDKNAPDKFINMSIYSGRQYFYQASNTDKRKVNYTTASIEGQMEDFGDGAACLENCCCDVEEYMNKIELNRLIQKFFIDDRPIEALIIDGICYQDSFKEEKTKVVFDTVDKNGYPVKDKQYRVKYTFNERMLVKHLTSLDDTYSKHFLKFYNINKDEFKITLNKLRQYDNAHLYSMIRKTLFELRNNKEFLSAIC